MANHRWMLFYLCISVIFRLYGCSPHNITDADNNKIINATWLPTLKGNSTADVGEENVVDIDGEVTKTANSMGEKKVEPKIIEDTANDIATGKVPNTNVEVIDEKSSSTDRHQNVNTQNTSDAASLVGLVSNEDFEKHVNENFGWEKELSSTPGDLDGKAEPKRANDDESLPSAIEVSSNDAFGILSDVLSHVKNQTLVSQDQMNEILDNASVVIITGQNDEDQMVNSTVIENSTRSIIGNNADKNITQNEVDSVNEVDEKPSIPDLNASKLTEVGDINGEHKENSDGKTDLVKPIEEAHLLIFWGPKKESVTFYLTMNGEVLELSMKLMSMTLFTEDAVIVKVNGSSETRERIASVKKHLSMFEGHLKGDNGSYACGSIAKDVFRGVLILSNGTVLYVEPKKKQTQLYVSKNKTYVIYKGADVTHPICQLSTKPKASCRRLTLFESYFCKREEEKKIVCYDSEEKFDSSSQNSSMPVENSIVQSLLHPVSVHDSDKRSQTT